jgi:hypothetical protein
MDVSSLALKNYMVQISLIMIKVLLVILANVTPVLSSSFDLCRKTLSFLRKYSKYYFINKRVFLNL